jgi:hypothetical protein
MSNRILVTDETSAGERLSVTDTGFTQIGTGAGTSRVTANGNPFCNGSGQIAANRNVPDSTQPTQSTTTVGPFGSTTVTVSSTWNGILTWSVVDVARHTFQSGFPLTCNTTSGGPKIQASSAGGNSVTFTSQDSQVAACPLGPGTANVVYTYL